MRFHAASLCVRFLGVLALLCGSIAPASADETQSTDYRAMTYNIRLDLASDGENSWPNRRHAVSSLIAFYRPDFAGLQEVLLHQKQALAFDLPGYALVGVARDDGREAGEFSPLAYRRERFKLSASGTFWLSPTPAVPSKGWDAAYPRIASWAKLRDRRSGQRLLVVNTHFDHVGTMARFESARLLHRWIHENLDRRTVPILLGDFNSGSDSDPVKIITANTSGSRQMRNARESSQTPPFGPIGTFNGFEIGTTAATAIDHIFTGTGAGVLRHATITQHEGGRLPSDHYPVIADIYIKNRR